MRFTLAGILAGAFLLIFTSCKKDTGLGGDLLPGNNPLGLVYEESNELLVSTVLEQPLRTDRMFFNYIGTLQSPVFGTTTARSFIEISRPSTLPPDSLGPYTLKSVVLNLFYDKYFGDTTEPVTWDVFKVEQTPAKTSIFNSDFIPAYSQQKLGTLSNYLIKPNTPIKFSEADTTVGRTNFLQIKLENFLGFSFINLLSSETLKRDSLFWAYFPGLYIQPSPLQPGKTMLQMNYTELAGGIYVTMKNRNGVDVTMVFPIATASFYHTAFAHNYAGSLIESAINSTEVGSQVAYIQSQAGVKTWIQFPALDKYKYKLINKAVIEIYEVDSPAINTPRPRNIFPLKKGTDGKNEAILDYSSGFYGPARIDTSTRDEFGNRIVKYQLNISNYFKDLVFGKNENNGIYLTNYPIFDPTPGFIFNQGNIIQSQYVEPSSVIIGGPAHPDTSKRMRLKVWYSMRK
jgi:hypothetical protein